MHVDTSYQPDLSEMTQYQAEAYINTLPKWELNGDAATAMTQGVAMMQTSYKDVGAKLSTDIQYFFDPDYNGVEMFDRDRGSLNEYFFDAAEQTFRGIFDAGLNLDVWQLHRQHGTVDDFTNYSPNDSKGPMTRDQEEEAILESIGLKMQFDAALFTQLGAIKRTYGDDVLDRYTVTGKVTQEYYEDENLGGARDLDDRMKSFMGTHIDMLDIEGMSMQLTPLKADGYLTETDMIRVPRFYMDPGSAMYNLIKDHVDMDPNSENYGMLLDGRGFVAPDWWKAHGSTADYNKNLLTHYFDSKSSPNVRDYNDWMNNDTTDVPNRTPPTEKT